MKSLLLFFLLLSIAAAGYSQSALCRIYYDYDAAGNRVQRYYHCYDDGTEQPADPEFFHFVLYPNPTTGPITVAFDELVVVGKLSVVSMSGTVIGYNSCNNCYDINFAMDALVPGSYIVTVNVGLKNGQTYDFRQDFTVVKMQ